MGNHYLNNGSPFKSNQEINNTKKDEQNNNIINNSNEIINNQPNIINSESPVEKKENGQPVKVINCAICDKPFPQDRLEKCYYEK